MAYNGNVLTSKAPPSTAAKSPSILLRLINNRRTFILLTLLLCIILLSSMNLINSVLSWYASAVTASSSSSIWWRRIYASVAVGVIFGVLSMAAVLAVAVPATVVIWITVLVLLTFCGKTRESVVVEGKKLTVEMSRTVCLGLIKEGNLVAVICAIFGYFLLFRYKGLED